MIHYHGLPMTPLADMIRAMKARHAMVSFEDYRQIEEACEICQSDGAMNAAARRRNLGLFASVIDAARNVVPPSPSLRRCFIVLLIVRIDPPPT